MELHRTRPRPDRHCSLAPRRLVARRDADAFANKFKRKWTRLCFCDIMVTEMRKRWWIRPTLGCVICNDRKAGMYLWNIRNVAQYGMTPRCRAMPLHAAAMPCSRTPK